MGFVSPLELQCLWRSARMAVLPTLFEAASFPLWEAFEAGVPAACSNVTSLPAQAGDAAILFDPTSVPAIADAIERLWTDAALRRSLIDAVAGRTWPGSPGSGRPNCSAHTIAGSAVAR